MDKEETEITITIIPKTGKWEMRTKNIENVSYYYLIALFEILKQDAVREQNLSEINRN
jgi:hypothetical protein